MLTLPHLLLMHLALHLPERIGWLLHRVVQIAAINIKLLGHRLLGCPGHLDLLLDLLPHPFLMQLLQHLPLLLNFPLPVLDLLRHGMVVTGCR